MKIKPFLPQKITRFWQKKLRSYLRPKYSKLHLNLFTVVIGAAFFSFGMYFAISGMIRFVKALDEVTHTMPTDTNFAAAGYSNDGTFATAGEVRLATGSAWWNGAYLKKQVITLNNLGSANLPASGSSQITVNTQSMVAAGLLQEDCDDLRMVYVATASGSLLQELPRSYQLASGASSCANSASTIISFPRQAAIAAGGVDSNYELYYDNAAASAPSSAASAFDITRDSDSTVSATLVCPFNGSTTCVGGETPSSQSGAIRYAGGRSALSFDGKDDMVSFDSLPAISAPYSISLWFNPRKLGVQPLISLSDYQPVINFGSNNKILIYAGPEKYRYGTKVFANEDLNTWWHTVLVVVNPNDLSTWKVYLNGVDDSGGDEHRSVRVGNHGGFGMGYQCGDYQRD